MCSTCLLSFILQMWPNRSNSIFLMSSFSIMSRQLIIIIRRWHSMSNANSFFLSVSFSVHVSDAYSSTLKMHVVNISSLLSILGFLLSHICFREATVSVAFPILLLISSEQLLSHVSRLPRYSNFSTFPMVFPATCTSSSMFLSPKTKVLILFVCTRSPACSAASPVSSIQL